MCLGNTNCQRWVLSFLKDILPVIFIYETQGMSHNVQTIHSLCAGETAPLSLPGWTCRSLYLLHRQLRVGWLKLVPAGIPRFVTVMQAPGFLYQARWALRPQGFVLAARHYPPHPPSQSQSPLSYCAFLHQFPYNQAPSQNLFQILQIKFLCLQCFSSFLQYIHISELPLNTIIVHLASNYSNRKTGNHCHSDCGKSMLHRGTFIHPMECFLR